jgi:hypothetical protein
LTSGVAALSRGGVGLKWLDKRGIRVYYRSTQRPCGVDVTVVAALMQIRFPGVEISVTLRCQELDTLRWRIGNNLVDETRIFGRYRMFRKRAFSKRVCSASGDSGMANRVTDGPRRDRTPRKLTENGGPYFFRLRRRDTDISKQTSK